ncbi:substrate-binding periplasmic protein [Pseudoalteromonas mariniglutinosa]|uniref:substrate-binding periplasmic protein n=1 Tax=Pseudoalteromonas mariniglutinosa TaxID=206042 RepID=UPI00384FECF7
MLFRLLIYILFIITSRSVSADNTLTIIAEDLPPYHFRNDHGHADGALVEITKALLKEAKLTAHFEIMPMARAFHDLELYANTLMMSLLKTSVREQQFQWVTPMYVADAYLVSLKTSAYHINSLNDAKAYRVATIRGYSSEQYLKQAGFSEDNNLVLVSHYQQLWQMLKKGRIDFVLTNTLTLNNELKRSELEPKAVKKTVHLDDFPAILYLTANKQLNQHTVTMLKHAMAQIKQNGQYQAILTAWQLPIPPLSE